jgi:hypothetical protein
LEPKAKLKLNKKSSSNNEQQVLAANQSKDRLTKNLRYRNKPVPEAFPGIPGAFREYLPRASRSKGIGGFKGDGVKFHGGVLHHLSPFS